MCVVSMVHDHYEPLIPKIVPWVQPQPTIMPGFPDYVPYTITVPDNKEVEQKMKDLQEVIDSFKKAKEAAETVDKLTKQPDCVDPKKAQLEARIKELEEQIALTERVIELEKKLKELEGLR